MNYELTILIPAIRTIRWPALYDSLIKACPNLNWQLLLVTPFKLPTILEGYSNIKVIEEFGCVSRAVQRGVLEVDSQTFFLTVDDAIFVEGSITKAFTEYKKKCRFIDVLNIRYSENGDIQPPEYYCQPIILPGIHPDWQIAPQPMMAKGQFIDVGGFDCQFEYINEAVHDFMFRLQARGGKVYQSSNHACVATWYESITGDHAPVHYAQKTHDWPIFLEMYKIPNDRHRLGLGFYHNWKNSPKIWLRRFKHGVPKTYEELIIQEKYIL